MTVDESVWMARTSPVDTAKKINCKMKTIFWNFFWKFFAISLLQSLSTENWDCNDEDVFRALLETELPTVRSIPISMAPCTNLCLTRYGQIEATFVSRNLRFQIIGLTLQILSSFWTNKCLPENWDVKNSSGQTNNVPQIMQVFWAGLKINEKEAGDGPFF